MKLGIAHVVVVPPCTALAPNNRRSLYGYKNSNFCVVVHHRDVCNAGWTHNDVTTTKICVVQGLYYIGECLLYLMDV
jgi:hypothetical protein